MQWWLFEATALLPVFGWVFTLAAQFLAAVGTGVVLLYVVSRGNQLAEAKRQG